MIKRLTLLNGIAILAVVCNHAASWGITAMLWWTDQYSNVQVPNFDRMGTLPYHVLVTMKQLTVPSIPAFLFVSGFFMAFTLQQDQIYNKWKINRQRLVYILIPYILWSLIIMVGDNVLGYRFTPLEYIRKILLGGAIPPYFYVIIITQFYLLSPYIVKIAKYNWKILLICAGLAQLLLITWNYLYKFLIISLKPPPLYLFIWWVFFIGIGIVGKQQINRLKTWLSGKKTLLNLIILPVAVFAIVAPNYLVQVTNSFQWISDIFLVSTSLYAIVFILWFLAKDQLKIPFTQQLSFLGKHVYGIYLIHPIVLLYVSKIIYHIAPKILAYQIIYQPILISSAVIVPLFLMQVVKRSPFRKYYRYLFG